MKKSSNRKIEWNKVTWYSKIIALILFVVLPFIGFWYGTQYGEAIGIINSQPPIENTANNQDLSTTGVSAYYMNTAEWQTDANNTAGGFSIAYPIDFPIQDNYSQAPTTNWRVNNDDQTVGIVYFTLNIPAAFEPQTNFSDAQLTVGASAQPAALADCLMPSPDGPSAATSTIAINGVNFTIFQSSDVGAGNIYQTASYRTTHAGKCYAVEYTIHSSEIGNYPSQYNLKPLNQTVLTDLLDRMVGTFKFI